MDSEQFQESLFYLRTYGNYLAVVDFHRRHGYYMKAVQYILDHVSDCVRIIIQFKQHCMFLITMKNLAFLFRWLRNEIYFNFVSTVDDSRLVILFERLHEKLVCSQV